MKTKIEIAPRVLLLLALAGAGAPTHEVHAQDRPVEFGVDVRLAHTRTSTIDPQGTEATLTSTGLVAPTGGVRLAFWLSDRTALDVLARLAGGRTSNGTQSSTSWSLSLTPGLAYHFAEAGGNQPYVRVDAAANVADSPGRDLITAWGAGAAAGMRVPVLSRAFLRFEAGYLRQFESDVISGSDQFHLGTGLMIQLN